MYKIVFLDIDGTLVNREKVVSDTTKQAIKKLKQNGLQVVLATGRPPYHFGYIAEELDISSFVAFNGAYVCHDGELVHATPLDRDALGKLVKLAKENGHPLIFSNHEKAVSNELDHPEVLESYHSLKLDYRPECQPDFWRETDLYQAMLYCKAHEERAYQQAIPEFSFVRWHPLSMDVMPARGSKATGIQAMLDHLGLSPNEAVAFGDGLNDREMLTYVGMGVAMGNAHEEIKPYAKMVTKTNDEDGVVYALNGLGLI